MTNKQAVWVTGLGLATPLGSTFAVFSERLCAGKSGIRPIVSFDTKDHACKIAGFVDDLPCPPGIDPATFDCYTPWQQLLFSCAARALQDAGWWERRSDVRIGLVLGSGSEWMIGWEIDAHCGGRLIWEPDTNGDGYAHFLQDQLELRGPSATVAAACATGNIALGLARRWIRQGWVDVVLAGAGERPVTPMGVGGFGNLGALSRRNDRPSAASRPFDRDRDGFVMSEGGAMFVLEAESSARRRGGRSYGVVAGFGVASDAFHLVAPSQDARYAAQAIAAALDEALLTPGDVDYVNAHGTSTPVGDVFEAQALRQALGEHVATVPVSGTKSMTGHMLGAASAVEAAVCLTAFHQQAVPPTINLDEPDPNCTLCHVPNQAQPRRVDVALSNSFGFGGINTCLVLQRAA